jgi:hypothetical protein
MNVQDNHFPKGFMMTRSRFSSVILAAPLLLLPAFARDARASSSSESIINEGSFLTDSGPISSSVVSGGNAASSFVTPLIETIGAAVSSDGTAFSVSTSSSHRDDWCPEGASCSAVSSPLNLSAAISFDAVVSSNLAKGQGEFDLLGKYTVGSDSFVFAANADSTPMSVSAMWDGESIPISVATDAAGNVHVSTNFIRPIICPCVANDAPLFVDVQSISLEMEGRGFVDASHTFTVTLAPLDPSVLLTSADGRTAGSAPAASPVPEPASMLLVGTGLATLARRSRRR